MTRAFPRKPGETVTKIEVQSRAAVVRWDVQGSLTPGELGARCEAALDMLRAGGAAVQLAFLCDTRPVHRTLFADHAPDDLPEAAGEYRGTPGSALMQAERVVKVLRRPGLRVRDPGVAAGAVASEMSGLALRVREIWASPQAGDAAYADLAELTYGFLRIQPYLDGNGHVCRIMLPLLAARSGLARRSAWTLHPRPYDHVMSLCLQWYPDHPALLSAYLRRWFGETGGAVLR